MESIPCIFLLTFLPVLAIAGSFTPLSDKTLYVAKRQFEVEPSSLSGVWRYTPADMQYDVESLARFIQSSPSMTILEIGETNLDNRDYILALVEDGKGQKLFVLFNRLGHLSYKTAPYNPDQVNVPVDVTAGLELEAACHSIEGAAHETGGEVSSHVGQVYDDQGNIYEGCEVHLAYDPEIASHPFYVSAGDDLFKKGWIQSNERAADGDGISISAIENANIFCNITIRYGDKSETATAECFDKNKQLNQPYR